MRPGTFLGMTIAGSVCLIGAFYGNASAQDAAKKPFTVADEIGLTLFNDPDGRPPEVRFSPDGRYFAVWSEQGRLDSNSVEDSLRFYRSEDVRKFLEQSGGSQPPSPAWVATRTSSQGRVIDNWRWLDDSSGVAFLQRAADRSQSLVLADLRWKTVEPLLSDSYDVQGFDIRDRNHYVYLAAGPEEAKSLLEKTESERSAAAIVVTGRDLDPLLFPDDPLNRGRGQRYLWAVVDGKRFQVKRGSAPLSASDLWYWALALSPDGQSLAAILRVKDVPQSWERLYPPPYPSAPSNNLHTGGSVVEFVRIDLKSGSVQSLTDAPHASSAGWEVVGDAGPAWSSDGRAILLPGTFVRSGDNAPSQPCIAVADLSSNERTCVEKFRSRASASDIAEDRRLIMSAEFVQGDKNLISVEFYENFETLGRIKYRRTANGDWELTERGHALQAAGPEGLEITLKQGLNDPPALVAAWKQMSRTIWDPNPQLQNLGLGEAAVYTWKDAEGRNWKGGLYKPVGYVRGRRYPLVIQDHGFSESSFLPSGVFPTAFAARALAAQGITVLQVGGSSGCSSAGDTPEEGTCAISGYVSGAKQLISEGLVDPERIGVIGFSRTCYYVMEALTTNALPFKAASITDGGMATYSQYIMGYARGEFESMIGARPFGEGLQQWLRRSPGFNLDKVKAPLLVVAEGRGDVLFMWEPYAGLYYQHKPVELVMLNSSEHVLTNPAARMASQGGSVDWFRFWLKGEEDPDPAKAEQYKRWRGLRKMQAENDKNSSTPAAATN